MVFLKTYVYIHHYKFLYYCDLGMLTSKQKSLEGEENKKKQEGHVALREGRGTWVVVMTAIYLVSVSRA